MSAETQPPDDQQADLDQSQLDERNAAIQAAYEKHNRPPSMRQAGRESSHGRDAYLGSSECWDDALRQAGVPGHDDVIAEAVRERFDERYPWQEFITLKSKHLCDETGLTAHQIALMLTKFATGDRSHDCLTGVTISRVGMGSSAMKWRVEPCPGGGESS